MSTSHLLQADGCDDTTYALVDLTEEQHQGAQLVAAALTAHGGGCRPTLVVMPAANASDYALEKAREAAADALELARDAATERQR